STSTTTGRKPRNRRSIVGMSGSFSIVESIKQDFGFGDNNTGYGILLPLKAGFAATIFDPLANFESRWIWPQEDK
ncbi:hypothetical protein, partial [Thiolapillus sp.]|uniref:hypothetical protein n=1 Tax=Thiolapillus sp. TaxID=2017437 RepID=UPI003AF5BCFF